MQTHENRIDPRLMRFAWMVTLVVVLRFVAWDLHHALDAHDHLVEETCELCMAFERGGDTSVAGAGNAAPPTVRMAAGHQPAASCHAAIAPCPPPRGPPPPGS